MTDDLDGEADAIARDARRFVRQLASGEATTADADALARWRAQSAAHDVAFVEAVRVWKSLGPGGHAFIETRGAPAWSGPHPVTRRRVVLAGTGLLAASAAGLAVVAPPTDLWPSLAELRADFRTATGEQRRVMVADVTIQMNTQTSIAVPPETGAARHIRLVAGEASFSIPAQSAQHLVVLARDGQTIARRARFDVRSIAAATCITCLDGEVEVEAGGRSAAIGAGRQITYDDTGLRPAVAVDPREATSWQDGYIVFRATPLDAAIAEINRYRPGRVMVLGAALGRKTVSGRFRVERTDEILGFIERAVGARSRALPGGIVLLS